MFKHNAFTVQSTDKEIIQKTSESGYRYYVTPDGMKYPSVTTMTGFFTAKGIVEWRNRVGHEKADSITRQAAAKGEKLHKAFEQYLMNEEVVIDNPLTEEKFRKTRRWLDKNIETVHGVEIKLYSNVLRLAGQSDLFTTMKGGHKCVVDFKTSNKPKRIEWMKPYFIQETAYSLMIEEMYDVEVPYILTINNCDQENEPQIILNRRDDFVDDLVQMRLEYAKAKKENF